MQLNYFNVGYTISYDFYAPDRKTRVRGSPDETLSCTLTALSACKIRRNILQGGNILQVPIQIIPLGVPQQGYYPLWSESKL